ncbi:MAG TPA: aldose epimerase, partial [Cyanobacteria bacterium UBA11371]|nr:aldose epimerase [Cyanobacteria bacterium UBA11371]
MFAIAIEQQQYQTYILSDSSTESRLEVVPQRGGMIARWQVQGEDILYLDAERFADPNLSVRGGIPILFPICGNLPDNTYTYQGKQYTLKQHGFARDMPWEVVDQVTQDLVSLTLVLNSNDQTRAVYPFEFQLAFTYELLGNCLNIRQRYTNHSTEPMPFSTGLHPYFLTTDKTQLQFDIPASEYQDQRTKITHYFNGNFDFDADEIDVAFQKLTSNSASVTDTTRRMQLTLDYDDAYSAVVFWTVKGKRYYCVEPWTATRNALNTGENLIYLDPGASLETLVRLTVNFS